MTIKKLWNRILKCGHERDTSIAFMCQSYDEPKIGDMCYCRECLKDVKIIKVKKVNIKKRK